MKLLDGEELVGYIKERQAKQVRALRQSWRVLPRLAIIDATATPITSTYVRLKQEYGEDILVDVDVYVIEQSLVAAKILELNQDPLIHGIILQLPLPDQSQTDLLVNSINPAKDVDGLGRDAVLTPATPLAIDWLLAGYNIELRGKEIAIVGNGRLVGAPLAKMWTAQELNVHVYDDETTDLPSALQDAEVIVSATGVPGLITSSMVRPNAIVVDAGTASEAGKIVGDVAADVRARDDITITPVRGGVGPLTVAALLDNVITAARAVADAQGQQDL